jgi:hypothetical protein
MKQKKLRRKRPYAYIDQIARADVQNEPPDLAHGHWQTGTPQTSHWRMEVYRGGCQSE